MRWAGKTLQDGPTFLLEAGGVGTLSYEHHRLEEPAILLGGGFMVDVVEVCGYQWSSLNVKILSTCGLASLIVVVIWMCSCANFTTRPRRKMRRRKNKLKGKRNEQ
jgi:hypothetical protein